MGVRIAVTRERASGESRVAATPESVRRLTALGAEVSVEAGAGAHSSYSDADYAAAGAAIAPDPVAAV